MDKFDRALQREILQALSNLLYLEQHELISDATIRTLSGLDPVLFNAKITHRGIDFIRDDGGLGAVLAVQIVKIHDSTIVAIEDILLLSNLPEEQKQGILAKLRGLPADAIKHLTLQLLTKAALNPQAVLQIIQTALHH